MRDIHELAPRLTDAMRVQYHQSRIAGLGLTAPPANNAKPVIVNGKWYASGIGESTINDVLKGHISPELVRVQYAEETK